MKLSIQLTLLLVFFSCTSRSQPPKTAPDPFSSKQTRQLVSHPLSIDGEEGLDFHGTENLILVPENRANAKSRMISIHFFHFPAKEKATLPPVFYLPGGPGGSYARKHFYESYGGKRATAWTTELEVYNKNRDLIIVNQRGNSDAPGFSIPDYEYSFVRGYKEEAFDRVAKAERQRDAFAKSIEKFKKMGMDPAGYDILNIVDDLEDIRMHYGYDKIALVGTSFGSQWALAYMQRHKGHVDRALLSGVEPLDHTYDDAQEIWKVYEQLAELAESDPGIKDDLPEVGLLEAFKTIVKRLEDGPIKVKLDIPELGIKATVPIGVGDFHYSTMSPIANSRKSAMESWPQYVSELYEEDYRVIALMAYRGRAGNTSTLMMSHSIDNSLGISADRDKQLQSREANRWLGDPSVNYRQTKKVSPTPIVDPAFRIPEKNNTPVLMIQGNMDWNTPFSNASYLMPFLENGHLLEVEGGTHGAKRELILEDEVLALKLFSFMSKDFEKTSFESFQQTLPTSFKLPKLTFTTLDSQSLFEQLVEDLKD